MISIISMDALPAGNECGMRSTEIASGWRNNLNVVARTTFCTNPGILLNLITGMTFMHHKAFSEGWSAYCYRLDGYVGIANALKT